MNATRRHALRAGAALGLGLAGVRSHACEFFALTLRITHPWTRATPEDAEGATVSMKFDEVSDDEQLVGVLTPVARRAELLGVDGRPMAALAIPRGRVTLLSEHGLRLRLADLTMPLELTRSYPMTLLFEKSGAVRLDLSIDYQRFL